MGSDCGLSMQTGSPGKAAGIENTIFGSWLKHHDVWNYQECMTSSNSCMFFMTWFRLPHMLCRCLKIRTTLYPCIWKDYYSTRHTDNQSHSYMESLLLFFYGFYSPWFYIPTLLSTNWYSSPVLNFHLGLNSSTLVHNYSNNPTKNLDNKYL